ncbi:MAG: hypothetical protein KBB11_00060 [Bacteroidales bacterium]|nr:hypothetical protein [Bacteroidales bacterium]HOY39438.1 hypothetical protein [Bacteroidales bacterium]HQP03908.1 hypothetical protein [Bacteroidales bacterium]
MNSEHETLLLNLQDKVEKLSALFFVEKEKNNKLLSELEQYKLSLSDSKQQIETLKSKYENLRFAGAFRANSEIEQAEAKQRLNRIIREIDQCIALLNK